MTIEGCEVTRVFTPSGVEVIRFKARARIDVDGIGAKYGDTCAQDDTSLHYWGRPLDSDVDRFIVLPPQVILAAKGICLGCMATVTYKGRMTSAVVGDVGPHARLGEISRAVALPLQIPPSPVNGGIDDPVVDYFITPGVAARASGRIYTLQAYKS